MRILLDTNVALDFLLRRAPCHRNAVALVDECLAKRILMVVAATSLPVIHHVAKKDQGHDAANATVGDALRLFEVADVTRAELESAHAMPGIDFEDNVQIASALKAQTNFIITRNLDDFRHSPVKAMTPGAFLKYLREQGTNQPSGQ